MRKKILLFPYANLGPLRTLGPPAGYEFELFHPRNISKAFADGSAAAAPLPLASIPENGDNVEVLGAYGIAASEKVGSVFLYSKKPFDRLDEADSLHLTGQSATSVMLLYVLLRERGLRSMPRITGNHGRATAALIIGDDALTCKNKDQYPYRFDMVTLWHAAEKKPFVFARWVVRKDLPAREKEIVKTWLSGLDSSDRVLVELSAGVEAVRLGLPVSFMKEYLLGMRRVLTDEDLEGQALFMELMKKYGKEYRLWREQGEPALSPGGRGMPGTEECVRLLRDAPLGELMGRAHEERTRRHPGRFVTYVMDTNPNYTNICGVQCSFCAFCRKPGEPSAYKLSPGALADRVRIAESQGATTVLLQGGLDPAFTFAEAVAYIRAIREKCPRIHLHPFSPAEIDHFSVREKKTAGYILSALWDEGVRTLPGGGAEIFSDRVRKMISPKKISGERWIEIMETAHKIGFLTTATMMFGHVETPEEIADHLRMLRESQERTGGYQSFVAWSFKPGNTRLGGTPFHRPHPSFYVRLIAVARLFLDNFEHIQSSWFSESENAGCLGLLAGADDFGGILVEENVHKSAGHEAAITVARIEGLIRESGFVPAQRDSFYKVLESAGHG